MCRAFVPGPTGVSSVACALERGAFRGEHGGLACGGLHTGLVNSPALSSPNRFRPLTFDLLSAVELLAVLSSGCFGMLLAWRKRLDFVGIFAVASMTAFGGGTLRDLFLDRHPLFWIEKAHYPLILFCLCLGISLWRRLPKRLATVLHVPDALGLGLFTVAGTGYALEAETGWFVASLMGVITGTFGGVIGDVVCNEVPSLFRSTPLYATCSFAGAWVYLLLLETAFPESGAVASGVAVTVFLRLAALRWGWQLPEPRE